ncbi:MAG: 1,2-phenylacetyl-CoA epoxidase subunit PaaC [Anaerolineae bacterium]
MSPGPDNPSAGDIGEELRAALRDYTLAMADDELLLGHRDAEWTGLGPILEEDIAFSSMAQDEMGHALVWYELVHGLDGPEPEEAVYLRPAGEWRNARLFELPRGDYAVSLVRQYLADLAQGVRYDALQASAHELLAQAARKLRQEEKYHLLHGRTLLRRLCMGTAESRGRIQEAVDHLFPYALGMWETTPSERDLVAAGIATDAGALEGQWLEAVVPFLTGCGLRVAAVKERGQWRATVDPELGGRRGRHGPELAELLEAMQALRRTDPQATW